MINRDILLTVDDFSPYVELPSSLEFETKLMPRILEIQVSDLLPLIGASMYNDFIANKNADKYLTLMLGETYTNKDNVEVIFWGVKPMLVYYSFANFVVNHPTQVGAFGVVNKVSDYSVIVSDKALARQQLYYRSFGKIYEKSLIDYMEIKKASFPLYPQSKLQKVTPRSSGVTITKVNTQYPKNSNPWDFFKI